MLQFFAKDKTYINTIEKHSFDYFIYGEVNKVDIEWDPEIYLWAVCFLYSDGSIIGSGLVTSYEHSKNENMSTLYISPLIQDLRSDFCTSTEYNDDLSNIIADIIDQYNNWAITPSATVEFSWAESLTGIMKSGFATTPVLNGSDKVDWTYSIDIGSSGAWESTYNFVKWPLYFDGDFNEGGYDSTFTWKRGTNATAWEMDTTMLPTGWFDGGPCMRISPTVTGKYIEMKTFRTSYWWTPWITILPNKKYCLKWKIKVVWTGTIGGGAKIACLMNDSWAWATSLQSWTSNSVSTDTGWEWVDLSVTFTSNSLATVGMIMVEVYNHTWSPTFIGDIYFSSLSLSEVVDFSLTPRKNLFTYTNSLSNAVWTKQNSSVSLETSVWPNWNPVYKMVPTTNNISFHEIFQNTSMVNEHHYVFSAYVKSAGYRYIQLTWTWSGHWTGYVNFDLLTWAETAYGAWTSKYLSRGIEDVWGGWYRIWWRVRWQTAWTLHFWLGVINTWTDTRGLAWAWNGTDWIYIEWMQLEINELTEFQEIWASYESKYLWNLRYWIKSPASVSSYISWVRTRLLSSPWNYYEWTSSDLKESAWWLEKLSLDKATTSGSPDLTSIVSVEITLLATATTPSWTFKIDLLHLVESIGLLYVKSKALSGVNFRYTFENKTLLEAYTFLINKLPTSVYINPDGGIDIGVAPTLYQLVYGSDILKIEYEKDISEIVNYIDFTNNLPGGSLITATYQDSASITKYGKKVLYISDERFQYLASIDEYCNSILEKKGKARISVKSIKTLKSEIRIGDKISISNWEKNFDDELFVNKITRQKDGYYSLDIWTKLSRQDLLEII